jgi:peroxiredoxin
VKKAALALTAAILLLSSGNISAKGSKPGGKAPRKMVENSAPDFALKDLSGKTVTLEQFIGEKVVILEFWATWCGPCRMTMAAVHNVREKFKNKGVVVFSVDQGEDSGKVKAYVESRGLKLHVLLDSDNEVSRMYGVSGIPTLFVIDKLGVVRARVVGYRPDLEPALTDFLDKLLVEKLPEPAK